jgi:type VI secretion system protein ImpC
MAKRIHQDPDFTTRDVAARAPRAQHRADVPDMPRISAPPGRREPLQHPKGVPHAPFIMGVLADLAGQPMDRLPPVADRPFLRIDAGNFDARLREIRPRLVMSVPNALTGAGRLAVDITFESLDDFTPTAIARKVVPLESLFEARQSLRNVLTRREDGAAGGTDSADILDTIVQALHTLSSHASGPIAQLSRDMRETAQALIVRIDAQLNRQINAILHAPAFQQLEGSWRGLHSLVSSTRADTALELRVMNLSKVEFHRTLYRYAGTSWRDSPVFRKASEQAPGSGLGWPFGALVADYYFDHSGPDVELLTQIAGMSAAAHTPFIAGVNPAVMLMTSWRELQARRDVSKCLQTPQHGAWQALRGLEASRYVGLAMPRFAARLPYRASGHGVEAFDFNEDLGGGDPGCYTWANAAYAMAANMNHAFQYYSACLKARDTEPDETAAQMPIAMAGCTRDDHNEGPVYHPEVAITEGHEDQLARSGLMPLTARAGTTPSIGSPSLNRPAIRADADESASAHLSARLPYLYACCRLAYQLKHSASTLAPAHPDSDEDDDLPLAIRAMRHGAIAWP